MSAADTAALQTTPLDALHRELGARMVPFAGYSMPVQYPAGLVAEHRHARAAAGLFDISHMGQLRVSGAGAAAALERLMPQDLAGLAPGRQRYALLLDDHGGILDDLMVFHEGHGSFFLVVNGACKAADLAHLQARIGGDCDIAPMPGHALLALQGPQAAAVLARLSPGCERFVFMTGGALRIGGIAAFATRSGYTGEDGFEISVRAEDAEALARRLLAEPEVLPVGLGARNSLRLEAGLCLWGKDIDTTTTPAEAALGWSIQKVRRLGGEREGGFPGADRVLRELTPEGAPARRRVGLSALERVPVRDGAALQRLDGEPAGIVTSGLPGPTADRPIAMGYLRRELAEPGTRLQAEVRGKPVPMVVEALPFVPARYFRG